MKLEKSLIKFINDIKPSSINNHLNISYGLIRGEADLLINNDHLIEIKTSQGEACTFPNLCQVLMYGFLLKKKDINLKKISIYNSISGNLDTFDVSNFNFIEFKKKIYQ